MDYFITIYPDKVHKHFHTINELLTEIQDLINKKQKFTVHEAKCILDVS